MADHGPAIKICGVTRVEDACLAEGLGADYIGMIFAGGSPRRVTPADARAMVACLTRAVPMGVFVEQTWAEIEDIVSAVGLRGVQVYRAPEGTIAGVTMVHAVHVAERRVTLPRGPYTDFFLCDTFDTRMQGGTGRVFDWSHLPAERDLLFVAGGIGPRNVQRARALGVHAVDVCSGVEAQPGIKDPNQLQALFAAARALEPSVEGKRS